jgi:hypothetical protein
VLTGDSEESASLMIPTGRHPSPVPRQPKWGGSSVTAGLPSLLLVAVASFSWMRRVSPFWRPGATKVRSPVIFRSL